MPKKLLIIVLIVVLAGGATAGYFWWQQKEEKETWKTYKNEEYGFEVKYPESWEMKEASHLISWISPLETPEKRVIFTRVRRPSTSEEVQCTPAVLKNKERILGKVVVDGSEFCKVEYKIEGVQEVFYLVVKDDIGCDIGLAVYGGRQTGNYLLPEKEIETELQILHQMLSTFKFLD